MRILSTNKNEPNQFVGTKKANWFEEAKNLPYIYLPISKCEPPQLIVESPNESAFAAGYAQAIKLPYTIASKIDEYPEGTMILYITKDIKESAAFGYANAVPLPYQKSDICIEKIDMLDTDTSSL